MIFLAGCGGGSLGTAGASLIVPRQLAERLAVVEVYLFETRYDQPNCGRLLDEQGFSEWKDRAWRRQAIDFKAGNIAVFDGIPDRGGAAVWRFYARGYDDTGSTVGLACDARLYGIEPGSQVKVTLQMEQVQ